MGSGAFWARNFSEGDKALRGCAQSSLVETSDFRQSLEETPGRSSEKFFEEWLYSPGFPEYDASYSYDESAMTAEITVEQVNAFQDGTPLFTSPIQLEFTFADKQKKTFTISMQEKKSVFHFSLPSKPLNVSLDPKNWILKKFRFHKPKEMYLYQLRNDENAMERVRAAEALGEKFRTDDVVEELSSVIDSDKFWGVKLEAAKYLGKIGSRRALDFLLSKKDHDDHRARRGVAIGLRYFAELDSGREEALDALINYVQNDYSYYVRAFAAESLGFFKKSEKALDALKVGHLAGIGERPGEIQGFSRICGTKISPRDSSGGRLFEKRADGPGARSVQCMPLRNPERGGPEALELLLFAAVGP